MLAPEQYAATITAALAAKDIEIAGAQRAAEGRVYTAPNGGKYYAVAIIKRDGQESEEFFMPKAQGRQMIGGHIGATVGYALLIRGLKSENPCHRCGGSGTWQRGTLNGVADGVGVCFRCNGVGVDDFAKFDAARAALPTKY